MPLMPSVENDEWTYVWPGESDASQVDVVRFYLQDTDPDIPLLADMELQFLVDQWLPKFDSLVYVAAVAAERVSAKFAGVVSVSADGVTVNVADLSERYRALAADLRQTHKDAQVGGEVDITNLMASNDPDWSIEPLSFGVGMHDSYEGGRQDYGTHRDSRNGGYASDTVRPGA